VNVSINHSREISSHSDEYDRQVSECLSALLVFQEALHCRDEAERGVKDAERLLEIIETKAESYRCSLAKRMSLNGPSDELIAAYTPRLNSSQEFLENAELHIQEALKQLRAAFKCADARFSQYVLREFSMGCGANLEYVQAGLKKARKDKQA
jgi:hypothetical protein